MIASCRSTASPASCEAASLAAINAARAREGLRPLRLPAGFAGLAPSSQLALILNAERTSRGLPALPENGVLDAMASIGAADLADPGGPGGYLWVSNLSWGYSSALAADYLWMYDDGPGGVNIACSYAGEYGCWVHRLNILSPWTGAMGTAGYGGGTNSRFTALFVEAY